MKKRVKAILRNAALRKRLVKKSENSRTELFFYNLFQMSGLKRMKVSIPPQSALSAPKGPSVSSTRTPYSHYDNTTVSKQNRNAVARPMLHCTRLPALPTTFSNKAADEREWPRSGKGVYPWKYYKITLMRGVIGLDPATKRTCIVSFFLLHI
jgi:hypothetical protein